MSVQPSGNHVDSERIASRVRSNVWSAAVAAILLCYFGFAVFQFQPITNAFTLGDAIFNFAIRIGGVSMAAVAVLSLTGRLHVLLLDACASLAIGVALVASGLLMFAGGSFGVNHLLYVIFGGTFVSAGLRNGRDFFALSAYARPDGSKSAHQEIHERTERAAAPSTTDEDSLLNRMRQRTSRETSGAPSVPTARPVKETAIPLGGELDPPRSADVKTRSDSPPLVAPSPTASSNAPPPADQPHKPHGGFLASFADKPRGATDE